MGWWELENWELIDKSRSISNFRVMFERWSLEDLETLFCGISSWMIVATMAFSSCCSTDDTKVLDRNPTVCFENATSWKLGAWLFCLFLLFFLHPRQHYQIPKTSFQQKKRNAKTDRSFIEQVRRGVACTVNGVDCQRFYCSLKSLW